VSGFYVWSHALDSYEPDVDGLSNPQDSGYFGAPFTPFNNSLGAIGGGLQEEYGPMNADIRSNAAMSGIWDLDYFRGSNKVVKGLLNGWQISPIVYLHSCGVFTATTGANKSFDSTNNQRPNAVPGQNPVLDPHRCRVCSTNSVLTEWFNTSAFTSNGPGLAGGIGPGGADGNVPRNSLYGPGFKDIDMGIFKNITFERGVALQLRAEATNVFNIVSLSNPTANLASGTYGKITSAAGTQRIIQLGGRLTF
jgi:hypothetical protein